MVLSRTVYIHLCGAALFYRWYSRLFCVRGFCAGQPQPQLPKKPNECALSRGATCAGRQAVGSPSNSCHTHARYSLIVPPAAPSLSDRGHSFRLLPSQEFFFVLESNLVIVLSIELWLGINPSESFSGRWHGMSPFVARFTFRTLFLAFQESSKLLMQTATCALVLSTLVTTWIQVFVAQMFLSGEGDLLLSLQALVGAVGMTAFTYFLPYVLLAELSPVPLTLWRKSWLIVNIVIGGTNCDPEMGGGPIKHLNLVP